MVTRKTVSSLIAAAVAAALTPAFAQAASTPTVYYSDNGTTFTSTPPATFTISSTTTNSSDGGTGGDLNINATGVSGTGSLYILISSNNFVANPSTPVYLGESLATTYSSGTGVVNLTTYMDAGNNLYTSIPTSATQSVSASVTGGNAVDTFGSSFADATGNYSLTELLQFTPSSGSADLSLTTGQGFTSLTTPFPEPASFAMLAVGALPLLAMRRRRFFKV